MRGDARQLPQPWLWLLLWTLLGTILRLTNLDVKPPWTDEFRTLVFSVGNSFQSVPLERVISSQDLLVPLVPNPSATLGDIIHLVSSEDRQMGIGKTGGNDRPIDGCHRQRDRRRELRIPQILPFRTNLPLLPF